MEGDLWLCLEVKRDLVLWFVCVVLLTMVYLYAWRRRRFGNALSRARWSPRTRAYDDGINRRSLTSLQDPESSWQCGKALSQEQLRYVREHCTVDVVAREDCDENDPCAICLDIFGLHSPRHVLKLNCAHRFHEVCNVCLSLRKRVVPCSINRQYHPG